jgi:uncharacterized LabA/DUF88 family protein
MEKRIAVLIDGENISHRQFERIFNKLEELGTLVTRRIYGGWARPNMGGWQAIAKKFAIKPVLNLHDRKNSSDHVLMMEAVDLFLQQPQLDAFCIVSSDSDFSALCYRLRDLGKTVIGIGEKKSAQDYRQSCSEFYVIDDLPGTECNTNAVGLPTSLVEERRQTYPSLISSAGRGL